MYIVIISMCCCCWWSWIMNYFSVFVCLAPSHQHSLYFTKLQTENAHTHTQEKRVSHWTCSAFYQSLFIAISPDNSIPIAFILKSFHFKLPSLHIRTKIVESFGIGEIRPQKHATQATARKTLQLKRPVFIDVSCRDTLPNVLYDMNRRSNDTTNTKQQRQPITKFYTIAHTLLAE